MRPACRTSLLVLPADARIVEKRFIELDVEAAGDPLAGNVQNETEESHCRIPAQSRRDSSP
jgi:hypothetical protein